MGTTNQFHGKPEQLGTIIRAAVPVAKPCFMSECRQRLVVQIGIHHSKNWNADLLKSAGG